MEIEGDNVIFGTGKVLSANCGIIGIGHDHSVSEGYDDGFYNPKQDWETDEDYDGLTKDEQIELADYMIKRWQAFRDEAN